MKVVGMRLALAGLVVITSLGFMPDARADLATDDPNDVPFQLDIRTASSLTWTDVLGLEVYFYEPVARGHASKVRVFYDAFGSPRPDFVLRFRYYVGPGDYTSLGCDFLRLSDHANLGTSPPDDQGDYIYCEFHRPRRMREHTGVRWRVTAMIPGVGLDLAPNAGWYPHT